MLRTALAAVVLLASIDAGADCLTPQWTRQNIGTGGSYRAGDVTAADFDGDGTREIAALTQTSIGQPWTRVIVSRGRQTANSIYTGSNMVGRIFASDANGDNRSDIIVADMTAKRIVVLAGKADGTFNAPINTTLTNTPTAFAVGDMTGDKRPDAIVYESTTQSLLVMKNDGTGRFTQVENLPLPDPAYSMATGDFDDDGALDVVLGHFQFDELTLLFGNGDGRFGAAFAIESGMWPAAIAAGDLDGDKVPDIVTADHTDHKITIHFSDHEAVRYSTGANPSGVTIAELTGDDKLDIAVATLNGDVVASYTNNGNGTFRTGVTAACANCDLVGIAAAEVNGDTRRDLITGSSQLVVYANDCGGSVVTLKPKATTLTAGEDATFDITVTNVSTGPAGPPLPTGSITLKEGERTLGFAPLGAQITLHGLTVGMHSIVAHYNGDAEHEPNASAPVTITVNPIATTTALTRTLEASVSGQPLTIAANVTPGGSTGATIISINGTDAKAATGSRTTLEITPVAGTYTFGARHTGDHSHAASTATPLTHVVTKATPSVTAAPLFATSVGQTATFTVTVAPQFTGIPTGTVRLFEGAAQITSATLDANGNARLQTAALTSGTHQLRVVYDGDTEFVSAQSSAFSFTVSETSPPQKRRAAKH
jgi:Bacterial Ig-like domain (group 3)/FG-GAP-like repeat